jgi:cell wall-associated NlpC family hydrolase
VAKPYLKWSNRPSKLRRVGIGSLAGVAALACVFAATPSASADPDPVPTTTSELNVQLAKIAQDNEQLTEQFNAAQIAVDAADVAAAAAQGAADASAANYKTVKAELKDTLAEEYKSSGFNKTAALFTSSSGEDYLAQLSALNRLNVHRGTVLDQLANAKNAADTAKTNSVKALADVTKQRDDLAAQKDALDAKQKAYKAKLASLTVAQQVSYTASTAPASVDLASLPAPSPNAALAVQTALAQMGKPYIYAAGGPNSFDCSGLTQYAWRAAGVSLPHNAAAQYGYGTHVPLNALQPGDLVFYYSPIGHVGMYIGNGLIVNAPTSGDVVRTTGVNSAGTPVGATRLT